MQTQGVFTLLLASFIRMCVADDFCVQNLRDLQATKLDLARAVNYSVASTECTSRGMKLLTSSYWVNAGILTPWYDYELENCADQLVPVVMDSGSLETSCEDTLFKQDWCYDDAAAVDPSSGCWQFVDEGLEFECVLCQRVVSFPVTCGACEDDMTASSYFVVHLSSTTPLPGDADVELVDAAKAALVLDVTRLLQPRKLGAVAFHRTFVDDSRHRQVELRVRSTVLASVAASKATVFAANGSFLMTVEDVDLCDAGTTVDFNEEATDWPKTKSESTAFSKRPASNDITGRDCFFDDTSFHGEWDSRLSYWELVTIPCESSLDLYVSEENYKQFLDADDIDRRHTHVLDAFKKAPMKFAELQKIASLVNTEVCGRNELYVQTKRDLVGIVGDLQLESEYRVAMEDRVFLLVADVLGNDPVVGFTCNCNVYECSDDETLIVNRKAVPVPRSILTPFAVEVSSGLVAAHSRVAFLVVWKHIPRKGIANENLRIYQYAEVTVMFPRQGEVSAWSFDSYGNYHVDITYSPSRFEIAFISDLFNTLACAAWNDDLKDWVSLGCVLTPDEEDDFSVCRCSGKYFVFQDGVMIAKYALRKGWAVHASVFSNNLLTDFLKDKIALMTATAFECLLSLLGLGSIICTAIRFKHWRENTGHKILLHMILALTCNLVLGFTANFVHMTADSVGCLVYGVLRHYSFLAMFLWMLVLSLLQMKRLTTLAGAKATTHLILKASLFAWGIPLLPIIILLCCNTGFYRTDRFDRGYCYPEGVVFQVTVQLPAGLILLVNLGIFIKIVKHIFECGGEKLTRHSKNEKVEQMNKLKTSFFIFFLFGFSWVFHLLSEERVFVSDFLFEYLFLMTTTTHIIFLALFFVVLQDSTRKEWTNVMGKVARNVHGSIRKKWKKESM